MSSQRTGAVQLARLHALGLTLRAAPALRDVDTIADAHAVAAQAPATQLRRRAGDVQPRLTAVRDRAAA